MSCPSTGPSKGINCPVTDGEFGRPSFPALTPCVDSTCVDTDPPSKREIPEKVDCGEGVFKLERKLGKGSFGEVYLGVCIKSGKEVAIKLESEYAKPAQLVREARIYKTIAGIQNIAAMHWVGKQDCWNVMVLDLLGPSLNILFDLCGRKFGLETVCMLAQQLLSCLEALHSKCYIHRDIKPHNFMVGLAEKADQLFMIDFGLARRYLDGTTKKHVPFNQSKRLCGTARYASINNHEGYVQSRRDDLESLGYMLVYFAQGCLPWQGVKARTKPELHNEIGRQKASIPIEELCSGLPTEFAAYLHYCRSLEFEMKPDYDKLRELWKSSLSNAEVERTSSFDWAHRKDDLYNILFEKINEGSTKPSGANSVVPSAPLEEAPPEEASHSSQPDNDVHCMRFPERAISGQASWLSCFTLAHTNPS